MLALAWAVVFAGAALGQEHYGPPLPSAPEANTNSPAVVPASRAEPLVFKTEGAGTLQVSIYLGFLLVVIGGGYYLLRNGAAIFQPKLKGDRKLNISETRMLGNRQFLVVAQYEDRRVLLGVCPGRIDYLCSLRGGEPEFQKVLPEGSDA
ncbi:MAG: flagellar biosynthetic protein FliO [Chthoniobacter sp.]|nr:flagellar biosynthetic protein FliO [Chthoniobacter sp.]